jgi:hypothetical protein
MNESVLTFILSVTGFLIVMLLGIIAFFLKEFAEQVKMLKLAVSELQLIVGSEKTRSESFIKSCEKVHTVVDKRLDEHGKRLDLHEMEISLIKSKSHP